MKYLFFSTLLIISNLCLKAQLNFEAPVKYHIGMNPRSVCSGDFNNDGILDIAVYGASFSINRVAILTGTTSGVFNTPAIYTNIDN
ncbi:MAG TPA: FG-GAP repeat protein, partial [Chitinophagaceae bacterium]|nr:FG-GAP repeat protein [Chitinophagaceae bacterium]